MNHNWLMRFPIFTNIGEPKSLGIIKIYLNRGALPRAPQRIPDFDVDLRPIKDPFAGIEAIIELSRLSKPTPRPMWPDPIVPVDPTAFSGRVDRIHFKIGEVKGSKHHGRKL